MAPRPKLRIVRAAAVREEQALDGDQEEPWDDIVWQIGRQCCVLWIARQPLGNRVLGRIELRCAQWRIQGIPRGARYLMRL